MLVLNLLNVFIWYGISFEKPLTKTNLLNLHYLMVPIDNSNDLVSTLVNKLILSIIDLSVLNLFDIFFHIGNFSFHFSYLEHLTKTNLCNWSPKKKWWSIAWWSESIIHRFFFLQINTSDSLIIWRSSGIPTPMPWALTHFFPPFQHLLSERLRLSA